MAYKFSQNENRHNPRIQDALQKINDSMRTRRRRDPMPFVDFLEILSGHPEQVLRNVFQVFHDMIKSYIPVGLDEYPDDPESIHFVNYDCSRLFIQGTDHPFFADRLFANRLVALAETLRRGAQQNKIFIFEGPHGCGKSTFLNNLLLKMEKYANSEEGTRFETVWRLDRKMLGSFREGESDHFLEKLSQLLDTHEFEQSELLESRDGLPWVEDYIEVPCPSHDNPILLIPREFRRRFLDELIADEAFKNRLFSDKEYEWVWLDTPCTICSSLYQALLDRLGAEQDIYNMIYARPYRFDRRLGEGITVFNPGDKAQKETVLTNEILQGRLNHLLRDSNRVHFLFSRYAKINNGVYALMDIKSHNVDRLIELHNIISEGVHKVGDIEERVNSLLLAIMNPEDQTNIQDIRSFLDRVEYIKIPYVLDLGTEVQIYRDAFGDHIDAAFLPRVLHNFARVIIASRLNRKSEALHDWIDDPGKYRNFCDENLMLLKMEIYTGHIPAWLTEEDRRRLTAKRRQRIISESETEGVQGFSGRESQRIFNEFYSMFARKDRMIDMSLLGKYFTRVRPDLSEEIPEGFLDSLLRMYNYWVLQEVKESLYYYNEEQISRDIQNYLFAVNFEPGTEEKCKYTGEKLEITEDFFLGIESRLLGADASPERCSAFRKETQRQYTTYTLTREIISEGKPVTETQLFHALYERYVHNLKEKVLDPILDNENFRRAIKDFNTGDFKTYDKRIRDDVTFLINNLSSKYNYTKKGARDVCIYVIDNKLGQAQQ